MNFIHDLFHFSIQASGVAFEQLVTHDNERWVGSHLKEILSVMYVCKDIMYVNSLFVDVLNMYRPFHCVENIQ